MAPGLKKATATWTCYACENTFAKALQPDVHWQRCPEHLEALRLDAERSRQLIPQSEVDDALVIMVIKLVGAISITRGDRGPDDTRQAWSVEHAKGVAIGWTLNEALGRILDLERGTGRASS